PPGDRGQRHAVRDAAGAGIAAVRAAARGRLLGFAAVLWYATVANRRTDRRQDLADLAAGQDEGRRAEDEGEDEHPENPGPLELPVVVVHGPDVERRPRLRTSPASPNHRCGRSRNGPGQGRYSTPLADGGPARFGRAVPISGR